MHIETVELQDARAFIAQYHYLGEKRFRHSRIYGLYDEQAMMLLCDRRPELQDELLSYLQ